MGRYIEQSDVEDQFGIDNVKVWSDLENADVVNTARITRAIAYAEDRIDSWFRGGRYAVPFVFKAGIDATLIDWASIYAGAKLYRHRGLRDEDAGERIRELVTGGDVGGGVDQDIREFMALSRQFEAEPVRSQPDAPIVVGVR